MYAAVVQLKWSAEMFSSEAAYMQKLDSILRSISEKVPRGNDVIVVFPEDLGTFLCLMGSSRWILGTDLANAVKRLILKEFFWVVLARLRYKVGWVRGLAIHKSPQVERLHLGTFSSLASKYGFWIISGTACLHESSGNVFNTAHVFNPDGNLVSKQSKVHLIDIESTEGLDLSEAKLERLSVFDICGYRCGIAVCLDCFKDDVINVLSANKLDILIQPSANPGIWDKEQQLDWLNGCWRAVKEKKVARWGLNSMLVGSVVGLEFQGQSSIISANEECLGGYFDLEPRSGFVCVASSSTGEDVLIAELK